MPKTVKYRTWIEPIYRFHIPFPVAVVCDECGYKQWHFEKKGIWKYKEVTHKEKMAQFEIMTEELNKVMSDYYSDKILEQLESNKQMEDFNVVTKLKVSSRSIEA